MAKNPVATTKAKASGGDDARLNLIRERAERARDFEKQNLDEAIRDLEFLANENHWPEETRRKREAEGSPCLTINRIPQFVKQVTGDMRQTRPSLKAHGVDDKTDKDKAELVSDVLRYIENRSDATDAYFRAVDSQVACGIGHWRIVSEYCDDESDEQDLLIQTVDDQVNVLWDPDATKASREDAAWCFVPVDMTLAVFKERYPKASVATFDSLDSYRSSLGTGQDSWWSTGDTIRVAEYWERIETKTDKGRKRVKVQRSLVTGSEVLEGPTEWPGKYIPIIPVIGEEIRVGGRVVRRGLIRLLRDPQQRYNYWVSQQTSVVALQPKAPFLVTDDQIEDHQDIWLKANTSNMPFLTYTPDPKAPGAPQRVQPAVSSQGFTEGVLQAAEDMKAVTGIYDAGLGARSNETSGKAILARQREGDVGTFVYSDNFLRSLKHTGRVILDLLKSFFDTARVLSISGEDGTVRQVKINQPPQGVIEAPEGYTDGEPVRAVDPATDLSIGKYDVIVQAGPSYTTKREEAKDGMMQFLQANPAIAPIISDLVAKAQDWPLADEIAERLREVLPPPIKAKLEREEGEANGEPAMPQAPPPEVIAQQVEQQIMQSVEMQLKQAELATKAAQARKAEADAVKAEAEAQMVMQPPAPVMPEAPQPDPVQAIEMEAYKAARLGEVNLEIEARRKRLERDAAQSVAMGLAPQDGEPTALGPSPVELLAQAIANQGQALQEGLAVQAQALQALAAAQMAPKRIVRDAQNRVIGAETAVN